MPPRLRIAIVMITLLSATFGNNATSPLYVIYQQRFGFSALTVTTIFATYAVGVLVALVLIGPLSDIVGRKPLLLVGSGLMVTSTVIFLSASGTGSLFAARAVLGLATGTVISAGGAALIELEPDHDRQKASVLTILAFLSGAACGPLIFGVVAQFLAAPIRSPFVFELCLQGLGFFGLVFMEEPSIKSRGKLRPRIQRPSVPKDIRRLFVRSGAVVTIGWMVGGFYGSLNGSLDSELLHIHNHALVGVVLFLFAAIGGASQLLFRRSRPLLTMAVGVSATSLGVVLIEASIFTTSPSLFIIATVFCGFGNGTTFMGSLALVNLLAPPTQRAEVLSSYNFVAYFALTVPVVAVGFLTNAIGLRSASFTFAVVLISLSAMTLTMLAKTSMPASEPCEVLTSTKGQIKRT